MKQYRHPRLRDVAFTAVLDALADPWRLRIVQQLLGADDGAFTCSDFPMTVGKATRSHHFQVLREAGLVRMQATGNRCLTALRRQEIEARFPGLLGVLSQSARAARPRKAPARPAATGSAKPAEHRNGRSTAAAARQAAAVEVSPPRANGRSRNAKARSAAPKRRA